MTPIVPQVVEVGSLPSFVAGIDEKTVRWRQSFALAGDRLAEGARRPYQNSFQVKNPFGEEVSGRLTLVIPGAREVNPDNQEAKKMLRQLKRKKKMGRW